MVSSSEIVNSGSLSGQKLVRPAPEKSNFSQTVNLLSQYLKKNKGCQLLGDLNLGATPPAATMNLFPMAMKSALNSSGNATSSINFFPQQPAGFAPVAVKQEVLDLSVNKPKAESASPPLTIFYGGQVIVFNDFPAEKAKEIMMLASKGSEQNPTAFPSTTLVQKPSEPSKLAVATDLPIARKASLTRFLEKRKDRMIARAPYQVGYSSSSSADAAPSKAADNKSWLGLAPQSPLPI